jgi:hypothetical protein
MTPPSRPSRAEDEEARFVASCFRMLFPASFVVFLALWFAKEGASSSSPSLVSDAAPAAAFDDDAAAFLPPRFTVGGAVQLLNAVDP